MNRLQHRLGEFEPRPLPDPRRRPAPAPPPSSAEDAARRPPRRRRRSPPTPPFEGAFRPGALGARAVRRGLQLRHCVSRADRGYDYAPSRVFGKRVDGGDAEARASGEGRGEVRGVVAATGDGEGRGRRSGRG